MDGRMSAIQGPMTRATSVELQRIERVLTALLHGIPQYAHDRARSGQSWPNIRA